MDQSGARRPATLGFGAAAKAIYPSRIKGFLRLRLKFCLRALLHRALTREWLNCLALPEWRSLYRAHPRLALKLQHPYVRREWDRVERLAVLKFHYETLRELLSPAAREALFTGGLSLLTVEVELPSDPRDPAPRFRKLEVRLAYNDDFEQEGDLTLTVFEAHARLALAELTFCFARENNERAIWIGCLHANRDLRTHEFVKVTTSDFHGLRPKVFAVWCLQELAAFWLVPRLRAVGDTDDIDRLLHLGEDPSERVRRNDTFWSECSGKQHPDGSWELPRALVRRSLDSLSHPRRATYEQRYALLDSLQARLQLNVSKFIPRANSTPSDA